MKKGCRWSKEEIKYLEESWGTKSKDSIARSLGRSKDSIKIKANRLGLGNWLHTGEYVTFYELLDRLGIKYYGQIIGKLEKLDFPFQYKHPVKTQKIRVVYLDQFWKWSYTHQNALSFKNLEYEALGPEPAWVNKKRAKDKEINLKRRWTTLEDEMLRLLVKQNKYTAEEIAQKLKRTVPSVKRRIYDLYITDKPVRKGSKKDVVAV